MSIVKKEEKGVKKEIPQIITEGVNFPAIWNFDFIDKNTIDCNDVSEIYNIYGVRERENLAKLYFPADCKK